MITSQIALLLNGRYEHLTPDTHVDSLYIEKLENVSDSSVLVRRYSVYKHFPIAVNKDNIADSKLTLRQLYVSTSVSDISILLIPANYKLSVSEDNITYDLKIARLSKNTDTISSAQRHLLKLDIDRVNLSLVLYNYISKTEFSEKIDGVNNEFDSIIYNYNSSINNLDISILSLNVSVNRLNVSTNNLEVYYYNVSTNFDELRQNVRGLWKNILDTSLYSFDKTDNRPWTTSELRQMLGTESLEPGCRYLMHYSPSGGYNFMMMLIAVSKNEFAKKVYGIPYNIATKFGNYCNSHYQNAKIEQWDLRYNITSNEIIFMRDEWGNEAPYDFKSAKTFKEDGSNADQTTNGYIKNNIIKSEKNSNFTLLYKSSYTKYYITNNYIGYNNTFNNAVYITANTCNNYIGNNNTNISFSDASNCYIGNNNTSPSIYHANSCKIGNSTSYANIHEGHIGESTTTTVQSSRIDSNCNNVTVRGSYVHIYQNCSKMQFYNLSKNVNIYSSNVSIYNENGKKLENVNIHYVKTENTSLYFNSNVSNYDAFCAETLGPTNLSNSFYFDGTIYADGLYEES